MGRFSATSRRKPEMTVSYPCVNVSITPWRCTGDRTYSCTHFCHGHYVSPVVRFTFRVFTCVGSIYGIHWVTGWANTSAGMGLFEIRTVLVCRKSIPFSWIVLFLHLFTCLLRCCVETQVTFASYEFDPFNRKKFSLIFASEINLGFTCQ